MGRSGLSKGGGWISLTRSLTTDLYVILLQLDAFVSQGIDVRCGPCTSMVGDVCMTKIIDHDPDHVRWNRWVERGRCRCIARRMTSRASDGGVKQGGRDAGQPPSHAHGYACTCSSAPPWGPSLVKLTLQGGRTK